MLKLIVGVMGTGKTKVLLEMVNSAVEKSDGCVVCIEKGEKLKFDVKYQARLINTVEYGICNADSLYGMVTGLYVGNFDTTHIFIDSALKICGENLEEFEKLILNLDKLSESCGFECIVTSSMTEDMLGDKIKKYLMEIKH